MQAADIVGLVSVFFAGLLAGEEFVIRYGIRGPLASLEDQAHILVRQALIRPLRVLVPALSTMALLSASAAAALDGHVDAGLLLQYAGIAILVAWFAITIGGTVPINSVVLEWDATAPPDNWRVEVDRWERLNTLRTWTAVVAFSLLATGLALSTAAS